MANVRMQRGLIVLIFSGIGLIVATNTARAEIIQHCRVAESCMTEPNKPRRCIPQGVHCYHTRVYRPYVGLLSVYTNLYIRSQSME